MSLHKLWAGSGYEYLTRQVARQDAVLTGGSSLSSYYAERGESPGVWVGSGLAGIERVSLGDPVTAEQMRNLFGVGRQPLAESLTAAVRAAGASDRDANRAGNLGVPYRLRSIEPAAFDVEVSSRFAIALQGSPERVGSDERARLRAEAVSAVAAEWFAREHGRPPADRRELAGAVVRFGERRAQPVAGFDLTFSPVKSVSALWALAPRPVAAVVEECHRAAMADALAFVEEHVLFSREGARGVRQVEVRGLVATAFTHRDARSGDPDLHTHVAVANKVQTLAGKWLAIDGRALFAAKVAASETYNTALEQHLGERLGLRFEERSPSTSVSAHDRSSRRAVRELAGMDPRLLAEWSSRRTEIDKRRADLVRDFEHHLGRPPSRWEGEDLAQQATLETRPDKHEPRTLVEQRTTWAAQAASLLGGTRAVDAMISAALHPRGAPQVPLDAQAISRTAGAVVTVLEGERATWGVWHLRAEAQRQVRGLRVPPGMSDHVVDLVVAEATNRSVSLAAPAGVRVPEVLRRVDGTSMYETVGSRRWTSERVLRAERLLLDAAGEGGGRRVDVATIEVAIRQAALNGPGLNDGQAGLVRELAGSGRRMQLALAPAGTGKTTALRILADAWITAGGTVVGLAPSAAAAAVLAEQLGGQASVSTDTLAKLVWSIDHPRGVPDADSVALHRFDAGTLLLVDEAGLADSPSLARAVEHVIRMGGSVGLIGDDQQLGAVGAGGVLRDLADRYGAVRLHEVVRFTDPAEAAASLALREGRREALGFYLDEQRIHVGDATTAADQLFHAWAADRARGSDALMLAPTRALVADLNQRARLERLTHGDRAGSQRTGDESVSQQAEGAVVTLADQNQASAGDTIITRTNDRRLRTTRPTPSQRSSGVERGRWVRNGDRWTVTSVRPDGGLDAVSIRDRHQVRLPADYVAGSAELGYATTVHAAQGSTCDTVHGLVTGSETRAQLYTLLTRGRNSNHAYLQLGPEGLADDATDRLGPDLTSPRTATEILERILDRESDGTTSATRRQGDLHDPALRLPDEVDAYLDGLQFAADSTTSPDVDHALTVAAERLLPGLTDEAAWPTLRSQLLLDGANGRDPVQALTLGVALASFDAPSQASPGSTIPAPGPYEGGQVRDRAAVLHRRLLGLGQAVDGPLPWLPGIPRRVRGDEQWGSYLAARAGLVRELAAQIGDSNAVATPGQLSDYPAGLRREVSVWRAAHRVPRTSLQPLGAPPTNPVERDHHDRLAARLTAENSPVDAENPSIYRLASLGPPNRDPFRSELGRRVAHMTSSSTVRVDLDQVLRQLTAGRPLPDDHPSAALWWRLHRHLPLATLTATTRTGQRSDATTPTSEQKDDVLPAGRQQRVDAALFTAGLLRVARSQQTRPGPAIGLQPEHRQRLLTANELALRFYQDQFCGSWSSGYLTERLGQDLTDDGRFRPGHAPAGWTNLLEHLRRHGVTDDDAVEAGLVRRTSRGNLVDRFRDRLVLPLFNEDGEPLAFVGRRHPELDRHPEARTEPKYLNTPTTPIYVKSHHLYGAHLLCLKALLPFPNQSVGAPGQPVIVEGPLDAIAVTLVGEGERVGVAALGIAISEQQTAGLARTRLPPIVAFDADPAGVHAATSSFWQLASANLDPLVVTLPDRADPADLFARSGAAGLREALDRTEPLADRVVAQLRDGARSPSVGFDALVRVAAARPPATWAQSLETISASTGRSASQVRERFVEVALRQADEARRARVDAPMSEEPAYRPGVRRSVSR